jgi:hypothetical protein
MLSSLSTLSLHQTFYNRQLKKPSNSMASRTSINLQSVMVVCHQIPPQAARGNAINAGCLLHVAFRTSNSMVDYILGHLTN